MSRVAAALASAVVLGMVSVVDWTVGLVLDAAARIDTALADSVNGADDE